MRILRVATFNIQHGRGLDGRVDLERTAQAILATGADVVALQELDVGWARSSFIDQPRRLADLCGMPVSFHAALEREGAAYGLAVAGVEDPVECVPLPRVGREEARICVRTTAAGITVLATHLSRSPEARRLQTEQLARLAAGAGPVIVMGDLNQPPTELAGLRAGGLDPGPARLRTHPAGRPRKQIDHVMAGGGASVLRAWTLPTRASDHLPLVAEVGLQDS